MAEATEEVIDEPIVEPPITEEEPITAPVDDDGKPGGDDPQAVRARKEYQARKRAEEALAVSREREIRAEERARVLQEQLKTKPRVEPKKIWSIAEVNAAVRDGRITDPADADRYIDEEILPARIDAVLAQREAAKTQKTPIESAAKYIDEYIDLHPALKDTTSNDFQRVALEYNRLVKEDGLPGDFRTQKVALNMVLGTLDQRREKIRLADIAAKARTIPVDGGSGGAPASTGKIDISKAPATMQADWEREGVDQATRARRYQIYLDLKAQRAVR